jgi:hypothetical protein
MRFSIARAIAVDTPDTEADDHRWPRWLETVVTAFTGLTAIIVVSLVAVALGLN